MVRGMMERVMGLGVPMDQELMVTVLLNLVGVLRRGERTQPECSREHDTENARPPHSGHATSHGGSPPTEESLNSLSGGPAGAVQRSRPTRTRSATPPAITPAAANSRAPIRSPSKGTATIAPAKGAVAKNAASRAAPTYRSA